MSYLGLVRPLVNIKFNGIPRDNAGLSVLEIGIEKGYSSLDLYSPTGTARDDILVITQKQKTFIFLQRTAHERTWGNQNQ